MVCSVWWKHSFMRLFCPWNDRAVVQYDAAALWPWIRLKMAPLKSAKCSLITKCGVAIHKCHVYMSPCASSNGIFEVKMRLSWINRQWRVMLLKPRSPCFSVSKMKPFSFWVEVKQRGGQREITLLWMRHLHTSTFTLAHSPFLFLLHPTGILEISPTSKQTRRDVKLGPVLRWSEAADLSL